MSEKTETVEELIKHQKELQEQLTMMTHQLEDYQDALQAYENQKLNQMTEMQGAIFKMFEEFVKAG